MAKKYNEEIAKLKRNSYWLGVELRQTGALIKDKTKRIANKVEIIRDLKAAGEYDKIKQHERWKESYNKELDAFINLQTRLQQERAEVGRQILDLRQNEPSVPGVKTDKAGLVKLSNINYMCNKLIKKRKQQKLVKIALQVFRRLREQVKAEKPEIVYFGKKYLLKDFGWTLEAIDNRIAQYEADQKANGDFIQKVRDTIAKDELKKQQYKLVIENIKLGQSNKV